MLEKSGKENLGGKCTVWSRYFTELHEVHEIHLMVKLKHGRWHFHKKTKDKRVYSNKNLAPWKLLIFTHEIVPCVSQAMKINCILLPFTLVKGERKLFPNSAKGVEIKYRNLYHLYRCGTEVFICIEVIICVDKPNFILIHAFAKNIVLFNLRGG